MECANYHHKKAALLLGLELNKPENYEPGKEEPLLVALSLMNHEDVSLSPGGYRLIPFPPLTSMRDSKPQKSK